MLKIARLVGLVAAVAVAVSSFSPSADAAKPEDMYKGKIIITKNKLPMRFGSAGAFISALQSGKTDKIWPIEQKGNDVAVWDLQYAAFFAQPLNDNEVKVKFFDITSGGKRYVAGDPQYTREKGQRYFISSVQVAKPDFDVNKHYYMTVETAGRVIASTTFWLRGKGPNYDGKVQFSDEETRRR